MAGIEPAPPLARRSAIDVSVPCATGSIAVVWNTILARQGHDPENRKTPEAPRRFPPGNKSTTEGCSATELQKPKLPAGIEPASTRLPGEVSVVCATGRVMPSVAPPRDFFVFVAAGNRGDTRKSVAAKTRDRLSVAFAEVQRQLLHRFPAGTVPVPEVRAFMHGKRNHQRGRQIAADHQHIRLAIAGCELSMTAIAAEVLIAHRRAVHHLQLAPGKSVSNRPCRRLLAGEQAATEKGGRPAR